MHIQNFDRDTAVECAQAFSATTGLGCCLSDKDGNSLAEFGFGCESCGFCAFTGQKKERCVNAHNYGMAEAERFGGKYVYFCPMGLNCFVSPVLGIAGAEARITVGPFIMVDKQDFIDCDLKLCGILPAEKLEAAAAYLDKIPFVSPENVNQMSVLLFMSVGFISNMVAHVEMMERGKAQSVQSMLSPYISELKDSASEPRYPYEKEKQLLQCISKHNQSEAQHLLNELLGSILLSSANDLETMKSRVYELLVLISRTVVYNGTDYERAVPLTRNYLRELSGISGMDELCYWLTNAVKALTKDIFSFSDAKHANIIHQCINYISNNYAGDVSLERAAAMVFLSPTYLSRIFKLETGMSFTDYINRIRIDKAKQLLLRGDLKIVDISYMVGFSDQSYFTKVFKRITGVLPRKYQTKYGGEPSGIQT